MRKFKEGESCRVILSDRQLSKEEFTIVTCGQQAVTVKDSNGETHTPHISRVLTLEEAKIATTTGEFPKQKEIKKEPPKPKQPRISSNLEAEPQARETKARVLDLEPKKKSKPKPKPKKAKANKKEKAMAKKKATKAKTKQKSSPKKSKPVGEKVNINDLKKEYELWAKDITEEFNRKNPKSTSKVTAVCLVAKNKQNFVHLNLFDGTLGRIPKGAVVKRKTKDGEIKENKKEFGSTYPLKDEKAYEKKIAKLRKLGYQRR